MLFSFLKPERLRDAVPPRTVVLMRDVGIGDLVWHVPYFRRVARASADGQVTLLVPPSTRARELVGHEPWVRAIVDYDRNPRLLERRAGRHAGLGGLLRLARQLAAGSHDRVVMFTHRPLSVAFASWWAGVPQRVGFGSHPALRWVLSHLAAVEPYAGPGVAAYWHATALCRHQGWCDGPLVPRLTVQQDAHARMAQLLAPLPRPLWALAIGSSEAHKQWGADRFATLARLILARGEAVVLLGGPAEREMAQALIETLPPALRRHVVAFTGGTIAETAAATALADGCIGNDTGAANVAAAVGTPTWVVLGPRPLLEHDPERLHMIRAPSLRGIEPGAVLAQVLGTPDQMLRTPPAASAPPAPPSTSPRNRPGAAARLR